MKNVLIPRVYLYVGLLFQAFTILFIAIDLLKDNQDWQIYYLTISLLGVILIALCKKEIEDERTERLRLSCFFQAFIASFIFTIIVQFFNLGISDNKFTLKNVQDYFEKITFLKFIWFLLVLYIVNYNREYEKAFTSKKDKSKKQ